MVVRMSHKPFQRILLTLVAIVHLWTGFASAQAALLADSHLSAPERAALADHGAESPCHDQEPEEASESDHCCTGYCLCGCAHAAGGPISVGPSLAGLPAGPGRAANNPTFIEFYPLLEPHPPRPYRA